MQLFADRAAANTLFSFLFGMGLVFNCLLGMGQGATAQDIDSMLDPPRLQSVNQGFSITLPPASPIRPPKSVAYSGNNFDGVKPMCSVPSGATVSDTPSSGICGSVGRVRYVPREVSFGDRIVEIEPQCQWLQQCYLSGGETVTKADCDAGFRSRLEEQCHIMAAACGNLLRECLSIVDGYAEVVEAYGDFDSASTSVAEPPDNERIPSETDATMVSDAELSGTEWVYVGEYDGSWVSRNFDVQEMISSGGSMTATKYVNIRSDHLRKIPDSDTWENAEKIGVLAPGETVTILEVMDLGRSTGHIWARIER